MDDGDLFPLSICSTELVVILWAGVERWRLILFLGSGKTRHKMAISGFVVKTVLCAWQHSPSPRFTPHPFFSKPRSNSISSKRALQIPSLKLELVTLSSLLTQHSVLAFILVYCVLCLSTYLPIYSYQFH